mgnify:CR=1 FL=1
MNKIHLKFQLRFDRSNANGHYPIYLHVNINGERKYFSINHSIPEKDWNEKRQEVRTSHPDWNTINNDIIRFRTKAERFRTAADQDDQAINLFQFEKMIRSGAKDLNDFFSFIEDDIKAFGNTYALDTIKMYESQSRKLKKFRNKLAFNEITPIFWKQYDSYLIKLGNNENTRWKAFRTIKTFINKAIENGIIKTDTLKGIKVRKPEGNRMFLSRDEVKSLEKIYKGFLTKDLKNVLQYFLFSCYTGLRYSDVKKLKFSNIYKDQEKQYIRFVQNKTSEPLMLPLGKKASSFIPKSGLPDQVIFNVYSNQATNRTLKESMKLAGIQKSISFHCARHTFATIALELSGDIASVSKLCGHTKISTTQIYAKVLESSKRKVIGLMDAM